MMKRHETSRFETPSSPVAAGLWVILAVSSGMLGCSGEEHAKRADEIVEVPEQYTDAPVEGEPLEQWCSDFDSPKLQQLVDRLYEDNLDMRAAWARLEQAKAAEDVAEAPLWPSLSAEGSVSYSKFDTESFGGGSIGGGGDTGGVPGGGGFIPGGGDGEGTAPEIDNTQVQFRTGLAASYEIDIWGRLRSQAEAADLEVEATRADVESMAISLTSQLAETWFDFVYQRARVQLLEEQLETSERFLQLTLLRLRQGTATALDVTQQRQQVESLRGQIELAEGQMESARYQLATLLGEPPQEIVVEEAPSQLPQLPSIPNTGVPADLLQRRPDVRAARLRLEASDQRTEAAVAARLPSLRLSANLFLQAEEIGNLFDELLWTLSGAIAQPLFEGGRLKAEVEQAEATAEQQLYNYGTTLLTAMREVQDSLIMERKQQAFVESLGEQLDSAETALEAVRSRYRRGAVDYLRVLTTLQSLQQLEQSLLEARRNRLSFRIGLCRSLGGTWTQDLEPPSDESNENEGSGEEASAGETPADPSSNNTDDEAARRRGGSSNEEN